VKIIAVARNLVFDATAQDFSRQWQRIDWQLLQNSSVHRYRSDAEMERTATGLDRLGYVIHRLDAGSWRHEDEMHSALAAELHFPSYYGRNLDALNDVLGDVAEYRYGDDPETTGTVLVFSGYEPFAQNNAGLAHALLNIFAVNARLGLLVGHPMLCLISATTDFPDVGATHVIPSLAPVEILP
jgi:hypothetical protein